MFFGTWIRGVKFIFNADQGGQFSFFNLYKCLKNGQSMHIRCFWLILIFENVGGDFYIDDFLYLPRGGGIFLSLKLWPLPYIKQQLSWRWLPFKNVIVSPVDKLCVSSEYSWWFFFCSKKGQLKILGFRNTCRIL